MLAPRRPKPVPPPTAQGVHLPAPVGGVNTVAPGLAMPETDAVQAWNLISAEGGLRSRRGYREWCTGLTSSATEGVRSVLPFTGSAVGNGRLFATTDSGIWDVSDSSASPSLVLSFSTTTGSAGYGVSAVLITSAGHFLLYADEVNGLHVYSESGASWSVVTQGGGATQIDGVNPATFAHVAVFKERVWFVQRDTGDAWYLPTGQLYGTATRFPMGRQFRSGGTLVGLWNWTYDGGAGLDDSLVAVSSGGDVLVWQGTDPASATTFGLKGVWYVTAPPAGRRIASTFGGDMLLLTRQGIVPMSRLVVGAATPEGYTTAKVANLFNRYMVEKGNTLGWAVALQPDDNALIVLIPQGGSSEAEQLVQAVASRGWFRYRGLPIACAEGYEGKLYFGTADGRVCVNEGYLDNVNLAGTDYDAVDWSLLTSFSTMGTARRKRVVLLRPLVISEATDADYEAQARYDYDQTEVDEVAFTPGGEGTWDTAEWDEDVWGGEYFANSSARGGAGVGGAVAVAVRGTALARTVYVGCDVTFQVGGLL